MRASTFRPTFDRLDARIALSDASGIGSVIPITGTILACTGTSTLPGGDVNIVPTTGWFQGGTPPASVDNPLQPSVPIAFQTATSIAAN